MQVLEFKICIQAEIAKNMVNARVDFAKEMYVKGNKPTRLALLIVIVQMVYFAIVWIKITTGLLFQDAFPICYQTKTTVTRTFSVI